MGQQEGRTTCSCFQLQQDHVYHECPMLDNAKHMYAMKEAEGNENCDDNNVQQLFHQVIRGVFSKDVLLPNNQSSVSGKLVIFE